MKIGLVGEAPNDTDSIQNLLEKRYPSNKFKYFAMLKRINGSKLDSQKTKRFLRKEYEFEKPNLVVFIRDLDSVLPNDSQRFIRQEYFSSNNSVVDKKGIFLLNIFEIEALILSDIETFNRIYNTDIIFNGNPMNINEPKEYLRTLCKEYNESQNVEIFKELNFENVLKCEYFNRFIKKMDKFIFD